MAGLLDNIKAGLLGQWEEGEPYRAALGGLLMGDTKPAKEALGVGKPWPKSISKSMDKQEFRNEMEKSLQLAMDWSNPIQGVVGTFIGKGAKTWDAVKAAEAQKLLKKGIDPKKVWQKTGTFQGVDGHLRQEIDDSLSAIKKPFPTKGQPYGDMHKSAWRSSGKDNLQVNDLLLHDELSAAYPSLDAIALSTQPGLSSSYVRGSATGPEMIEFGFNNPMSGVKSTALHELQHAIQQREGWAKGGNASEFSGVDDIAQKQLDEINAVLNSGQYDMNQYDSLLRQKREILNNADPYEQYRRLAGEAEARLTQSRMNMTPEQRLQSYPYDMLDVPQDQLIIRGLLGQ